MMAASLLSTFHLLALAIGLPSVFLRGLALRGMLKNDASAVERVLAADAVWGVAALLWLGTGLTRAFGSFEKGSDYYLHNGVFLLKMGAFVAIFALEMLPMMTFIGWRKARGEGKAIDVSKLPTLRRLNDAEIALTLAIPFLASMMARGMGAQLVSP